MANLVNQAIQTSGCLPPVIGVDSADASDLTKCPSSNVSIGHSRLSVRLYRRRSAMRLLRSVWWMGMIVWVGATAVWAGAAVAGDGVVKLVVSRTRQPAAETPLAPDIESSDLEMPDSELL